MNSEPNDTQLSRRGLLKGAVLGAAALGAAHLPLPEAEAGADGRYPSSDAPPTEYDFTRRDSG